MSEGSSNGGSADADEPSTEVEVVIPTPPVHEVKISLLLFLIMRMWQSRILRGAFGGSVLDSLNRQYQLALRSEQSPRVQAAEIGMARTPNFLEIFDTIVSVFPTLLHVKSNTVSGTVVAFANEKLTVNPTDQEDEPNAQPPSSIVPFSWSYDSIDEMRKMFAFQLMKYMQRHYPNIIEKFGYENLKLIFLSKKPDYKMLLFLVSSVSVDLTNYDSDVKTLWVIMFQWLIFSRYLELFSNIMTQALQIPKKPSTISGEFMRRVKEYMAPLTPAAFIKMLENLNRSPEMDFKQISELWLEAYELKIKELEIVRKQIYQFIQFDSEEHGISGTHFHELNESMSLFRDRITPRSYATRSFRNLFGLNVVFPRLTHSTTVHDYSQAVIHTIQNYSSITLSGRFFSFLTEQNSLINKLMQMQIDQLQMQQKVLDEKIAVQQKEQQLLREIEETRKERVRAHTSNLRNELQHLNVLCREFQNKMVEMRGGDISTGIDIRCHHSEDRELLLAQRLALRGRINNIEHELRDLYERELHERELHERACCKQVNPRKRKRN
jgi:hypothetical protein